jgi:beta-glucanase (GH16 family)
LKSRFIKIILCVLIAAIAVLPGCDTGVPSVPEFPDDTFADMYYYDGMTPVFRDEFNGTRLNPAKWECEEGGFWHNEEVQYYSASNAAVSGGKLSITAERNPKAFLRGDGAETEEVIKEFGSARIRTQGRFFQTYGRFEASVALPAVEGLWPAFWMMPELNEYGGWPRSGEIDIMEARGRIPSVVNQAVHYGGYGDGHRLNEKYGGYTFPEDGGIEDFHVYAVEWMPDHISWFVDGVRIYSVDESQWFTDAVDKTENPTAPFNKDFHIILNMAVGGKYDQGVLPPESFDSAAMAVDYVRVWALTEA